MEFGEQILEEIIVSNIAWSSIAQLARRRTTNLVVGGSSPAIGTMFHNAIGGTYWTIVIMSKELSGVIFSRNKALQSAVISP